MKFFWLLLIVIVIAVLISRRNKTSPLHEVEEDHEEADDSIDNPFRKKEFLLNIPERRFFEELQRLIPANYVVFPQVRLSSIVNVNSPSNDFWHYQNKINRKTIDFVVFEKPYYKPVLGIEYDGKTHDRPDRAERDFKVDKMLESAGIQCLHIKHKSSVDFAEVKNKIDSVLIKVN